MSQHQWPKSKFLRVFNNTEVKKIRITLDELGHPQSPTPIHCYNTTSFGNLNFLIKHQRLQAINMRHFWPPCQQAEPILHVRCHPGQENLGDYQWKVQIGAHQKRVRTFYIHLEHSPRFLQRAPKKVPVEGVFE